jgi:NADH dehydrogenase [ubiquinone] 1 alpha subcomplex assembly factor 7
MGWSERQVGLADGQLCPGYAPPTPYAALAHRLADVPDGGIVETCPALPAIAGDVARRVASHGGVALIIDYGGWRSLGDTFQALQTHTVADPFTDPGQADLTAHVDFEALSLAFRAAGATTSAMTPQGPFLERLGIEARTERLARHLTGAARANHHAAYRRLTDRAEMGQLFKVIACHPLLMNRHCLPGLDPA